MTDRLVIQESPTIPVQDQPVEIVERKGKGHPDTIGDAIADRISVERSRAYAPSFGRILHHNIDKGLLAAGQVECRMGGRRLCSRVAQGSTYRRDGGIRRLVWFWGR